jgi:pyruvate kinase
MRRTKIICTMGPASDSPEVVGQMLAAGMNVARLNFSHGTHEEHARRIHTLRMEALKADCDLGILLDTKGPEIRTGTMPDEGVELQTGQSFSLDLNIEEIGSPERVAVTYEDLWRDVSEGNSILLDDGLIELKVEKSEDTVISTKVLNGGLLKSKKGVNVPNVAIQLPALTEKDIADITFGIEQQVDFIAASFTRKAADVLEVRSLLERNGANIKIIAKIENQEGLSNIEQILEVSDGVMVARGDLGVEIPVEEVPVCQKEIVKRCNDAGKPVVVATQMLDSMMRNPRPTRAEASDVANAILDGTDAIMLSGETASGKYPLEALQTMVKLACRIEKILFQKEHLVSYHPHFAEAIGHAGTAIAKDLNASAIITPTQSGVTARMISKFRPQSQIIAATPSPATARSLSLNWGVHSVLIPEILETDELLSVSVNEAWAKNLVKTGDVVVLTAGVPVGKVGATNMIKIQIVGNVLGRGVGIGRERYTGKVNKTMNPEDFQVGDILVAAFTDLEHIQVMSKAGAVVVETGGLTSHAAIAALQFGIPTIVGVANAVHSLQEGATITVDALTGVVYEGEVMMI